MARHPDDDDEVDLGISLETVATVVDPDRVNCEMTPWIAPGDTAGIITMMISPTGASLSSSRRR